MQYSTHTTALIRALSTARLKRYAELAPHDVMKQLELYQWNTALSEALYTPIQGLEIICRNYFHERLATHYGETWFNSNKIQFALPQKKSLKNAKEKLKKENKCATANNIVSQLSFGFWVGLLGPSYETNLWRPCLHKIFATKQRPFLRKHAYHEINLIRLLRNRIAHHEPILRIDLPRHYQRIIKIIAWFCEDSSLWIKQQCRFNAVWQLSVNPFIRSDLVGTTIKLTSTLL